MSAGANRKADRRELLKTIEALRLGPGDAILLRLPDAIADNPARLAEAEAFMQDVSNASGRFTAIVRESTKLEGAAVPPEARASSRVERVQPIAVRTQPKESAIVLPDRFRSR